MGVTPKSSPSNQMIHSCSTKNHPAIGLPFMEFYGLSVVFYGIYFYGFPVIFSMAFHRTPLHLAVIASRPPRFNEVWQGIQSSRLGGREAVQRLRGICDLDLNVSQAIDGVSVF